MLAVRAMQGSDMLAVREVSPVGVGEVFVVAGQSNGQGVLPNRSTVAPTDERVVAAPHFNLTDIIRLPLPPTFERMTVDGVVGPRGQTSWCWGKLGDLLVQRFNLPVAFYNVAWSGTSMRNWRESITRDSTNFNPTEYFRPGMPYGNLKRVLQDYVPLTGLRAVLWHQGEQEYYDGNPPAPAYYNDLRTVIAQSRLDANFASLPWVVARATIDNETRSIYPSGHLDPIWDQQTQMAQNTPYVTLGPDTDTIQVPRLDGVHLIGPGLIAAAHAWNQALDGTFFATAAPLLPQALTGSIDLTLKTAVGRRVVPVGQSVPLTLEVTNEGATKASGIRVRCQLPAGLVCTNAGTFTLLDGVLLGTLPDLPAGFSTTKTIWAKPMLPGTYRIATEIIRADQLDTDSRPNTSIADGQDDLAWVDFRTLQSGSTVYSSPPSYNAVVLPALVSNQPAPHPTKADLSLLGVTDRHAVAAGKPVTLSLVVTNSGGAAASNVHVYCTLPPGGASFSSPNMSVGSGWAYGVVSGLPANGSATLWFQLNAPVGVRQFTFTAQIVAATPADPDSSPNNGYTNGEDDTATVSVTVR